MFFFFKQKTAYDMRISDWSSDVCSSDLMSVYKHVLVALGLITACGHGQASEPVPTAAAATAMFYGIELTDTKVAELADVAPVAASTLLMFRAQPTIDPVDMRQNVSYFSAKPNAR